MGLGVRKLPTRSTRLSRSLCSPSLVKFNNSAQTSELVGCPMFAVEVCTWVMGSAKSWRPSVINALNPTEPFTAFAKPCEI